MERLYRGLASSLNTAPALGWALLAASALTLVSLLCSLLLAGLDSRRAAHLASNHPRYCCSCKTIGFHNHREGPY